MEISQLIQQAVEAGELRSSRISLRRPSLQDTDAVFAMGSDEKTVENLTWGPLMEREEAVRVIQELYIPNPELFIIEKLEGQEAIGILDIRTDEKNQSMSYGYMLNRSYWGQGYMTEALGLVIRFAFTRLGMNRVAGCHYVGNEGSGRVMEKCGMVKEGLGRQEVFVKGRFRDQVHYAILKEDYLKKENI